MAMKDVMMIMFRIFLEVWKTASFANWFLVIVGGAGVAEQIADLKRGSDIVVCTPGMLT